LRKLVAIFATLCCMSGVTLAQSAKPGVFPLYPGDPDAEAIVIPAGSPVSFDSFPPDELSNAVFRGRFTLSGIYELEAHGDDAFVTIWPDKKSRNALPYWRERGGPDEIYISNAWAFAQAVVPKDKLQNLKSEKLPSVHGHVTIIADQYETSIECDVASFSARFVSVVKPSVRIAAKPKSEAEC